MNALIGAIVVGVLLIGAGAYALMPGRDDAMMKDSMQKDEASMAAEEAMNDSKEKESDSTSMDASMDAHMDADMESGAIEGDAMMQ